MFEVLMFTLLMLLLAVCAFSPLGFSLLSVCKAAGKESMVGKPSLSTDAKAVSIPEDSILRRHFLSQLQSEVESALFPRPTDSVLQRHYDTLVANELKSRLVAVAE